MSEQKRFPWMVLPFGLISSGLLLAGIGASRLLGMDARYDDPVTGMAGMIFLALLCVIPMPHRMRTIMSMVFTAVAAVAVIALQPSPSDAGISALWSAEGILFGITVMFAASFATGKGPFHPRGFYVTACHLGVFAGVLVVMTTHEPFVIAPIGGAALLIGILLGLLMRRRKADPVVTEEGE